MHGLAMMSEDLDLRHLSPAERDRVWDAWLRQAQSTNDQDQHLYCHAVFTHALPWPKKPSPVPLAESESDRETRQ